MRLLWHPVGDRLDVTVADAKIGLVPADPLDQRMCGYSALSCLSTAPDRPRPPVDVLPVENDFFRLHRLHP
jgi:hypothetical protein